MTRFEIAIAKIDAYNKQDPNIINYNGESYPKEHLDSIRQSHWLLQIATAPSEELQLAARSQHIGRWKKPRNSYPDTRTGYLAWRSDLAVFHAETTSKILADSGYDELAIEKVKNLNLKKGIKLNPEAQLLEDVLCLVFLEHHITHFQSQHPREKVINIIQKTWKKMGEAGRKKALELTYEPAVLSLLKEALEL